MVDTLAVARSHPPVLPMPDDDAAERSLRAALDTLAYAAQHDSVGHAIQALADLGRAAVWLAPRGLDSSPSSAALRVGATEHVELVARAAAALDQPMLRARGNEDREYEEHGLRTSLFARSGYQVLLDMGVWAEPPLDAFHLAEVDTELADGVACAPPEVPAGVPASHWWWWRPSAC
jgi:hypothetical protein